MLIPSNKAIVDFFSDKAENVGPVDRLKIRYRPYVCPFGALLKFAQGEESVFDIGCGSGQFCSLLVEFTDVKRIEGIEIDQRLVDNARQVVAKMSGHNKEVRFSLYNGSEIPTAIGNYGLIYMIDVLHHIPPAIQADILAQVFAKMRPGAVLLLKDIDASSPLVVFNKLHDTIFAGAPGNEWSMQKVLDTGRAIGFVQEEAFTQRTFVYPHFFVKLRKPATTA